MPHTYLEGVGRVAAGEERAVDGEEHVRREARPADVVEVRVPPHLLDAVGDGRRAADELGQVGREADALVAREGELAEGKGH